MKKYTKQTSAHQSNIKVIHVLPDGSEVESIKGMVIPYISETHFIYELAAKYK